VQVPLAGEPTRMLDAALPDQLLALVELQAEPTLEPGGWDVSWWIGMVVFEGWEGWWEGAEAAAPQTTRRLRAFLEPARGHRLPVTDVVHGDLNLSDVLARDGVITGIVDWDHIGVGSRALDLTSLLFDWRRLQLADEFALAPDGAERLVRRIVRVAGEPGLRCTVA
jgi:Ser/Thr protein kinase RdoA (MazF antagonist)